MFPPALPLCNNQTYIHLVWPFLGTVHSKQWLCSVVLLMGLEGKTGSSDGFKCKYKLCALCEIQQDGGRCIVDGSAGSGRKQRRVPVGWGRVSSQLCRGGGELDHSTVLPRGQKETGLAWSTGGVRGVSALLTNSVHTLTHTHTGQPRVKHAAQVWHSQAFVGKH